MARVEDMPEDDSDVAAATTGNKKRSASATKGAASAPADSPDEGSGAEGEEAEEEGEYEIESIIDAKRGMFPDRVGEMAYLVHWKGYDDSENSWVGEQDAGNAELLIKAYWENHRREQRTSSDGRGAKPRKSGASASAAGGRRASGKGAGASADASGKGSERTSRVRSETDDDPAMDVDDAPLPAKGRAGKRANASEPASAPATTRKKKKADPEPEEEDETNFVDPSEIEPYKSMESWEKIVKSVETVEMPFDRKGSLDVYFTTEDEQKFKCDSLVGREKFPKKLVAFYENHLKWSSPDRS